MFKILQNEGAIKKEETMANNLKEENLTTKQIIGYMLNRDDPNFLYEENYNPKIIMDKIYRDDEIQKKYRESNPFDRCFKFPWMNELEKLESLRSQYYCSSYVEFPLLTYIDFIYQYFQLYPKNLGLKDFLIDELYWKHTTGGKSEVENCMSEINLKYNQAFF